jgi:hypothetical protein
MINLPANGPEGIFACYLNDSQILIWAESFMVSKPVPVRTAHIKHSKVVAWVGTEIKLQMLNGLLMHLAFCPEKTI